VTSGDAGALPAKPNVTTETVRDHRESASEGMQLVSLWYPMEARSNERAQRFLKPELSPFNRLNTLIATHGHAQVLSACQGQGTLLF
jgi:hypothetical protein